MPIPPMQCVKLRQNSRQCGICSTSGKILEPVVVNPDTVSNRASTGFVMDPLKRNGMEPMILMTIQLKATVTEPSLA